MKTVKGHPGIRKKPNGKFFATKSISGQRYYKEHNTLREAMAWKNSFHPLAEKESVRTQESSFDDFNGRDKRILFKTVYQDFLANYFPTLSPLTQYKKNLRMSKFMPALFGLRMCELSPAVISNHIDNMILLSPEGSIRCNFHKELKDLSGLFNWYKENNDPSFFSPIRRFHYQKSVIQEIKPKKKDITPEEFVLFWEKLNQLGKDLCTMQIYMAGRIGEVAGVRADKINLKDKQLTVDGVITWIKGAPVYKNSTKTGVVGFVKINSEMEEVIERRIKLMWPKCPFLFHLKGKALRYKYILEIYNKALIDAGLNQYSGTQIVRYGMAIIAREFGGVDAVKAVTRHTSIKMAEKYGVLRENKLNNEVVIHAEKLFKSLRKKNKTRASICVQGEKNLINF